MCVHSYSLGGRRQIDFVHRSRTCSVMVFTKLYPQPPPPPPPLHRGPTWESIKYEDFGHIHSMVIVYRTCMCQQQMDSMLSPLPPTPIAEQVCERWTKSICQRPLASLHDTIF